MRYTHTIAGLRDKRARLAGEIKAAERALAKMRDDLAALDLTLRLFHPDVDPAHITSIRPTKLDLNFRRGEKRRLVLEALRDAGKPVPTSAVTAYVMRAKGLDRSLRQDARESVRQGLAGLCRRGVVRRLVSEPEAWWEVL